MADTYWLKQTKPLFAELEWNKPERRNQAGRLFIIGGNIHNLGAPAKAFEIAKHHGIGEVHLALPNKTRRLVSRMLPEVVFLPSTPSGEFSSNGSNELLEYMTWADTVLLPGNFGRNSQVSVLIETVLREYPGQIVLSCDSIDNVSNSPQILLKRERTTLVVTFAQLQKLVKALAGKQPILFNMDIVKLVSALHEITAENPVSLLLLHNDQLFAAANGQVSTTKYDTSTKPLAWRVTAAATAACFLTWNPDKPFESLTHSASLL